MTASLCVGFKFHAACRRLARVRCEAAQGGLLVHGLEKKHVLAKALGRGLGSSGVFHFLFGSELVERERSQVVSTHEVF